MKRPKDAALHGFEAIFQIWDRAVADDVRGVLEEARVHSPMEGQINLARLERLMHNGRSGFFFRQNVRFAVAILRGLACGTFFRGGDWSLADRELGLSGVGFSFG